MDIYLIRHGETDWNKTGRLQGHADIPLNAHGRVQVNDTVRILRNMGVRMDAMFSSPLKRAQESAVIAAALLNFPRDRIAVENLLIERDFGEGEGLTIKEGEIRYPGCNFPGLELHSDLVARAGRAFHKIVDSSKGAQRILLVAHGAILFALLEAVSEEPISYNGQAACIAQGSIYGIRYVDEKVRFARYEEKVNAFVETNAAEIGRTATIYM